ncbi:hypothetical protein [Pelagihabitans pacificus]|uniref:hypothetical protein n=1 Tax=Pelagihabitans pacificus TaxID=2696054 RepID=UPI001EE97260|nr:hypothetical protein [Pelagihabitans pacificus]
MYAFQLYSVFSEDVKKIDENELLYLLMVSMVVIPVVYFIRVKLVDKYVHGIDLEAMEAELDSIRKKQGLNGKKTYENENELGDTGEKKYRTLTEKIEYGLSTNNLERQFKKLQHSMKSLLHL